MAQVLLSLWKASALGRGGGRVGAAVRLTAFKEGTGRAAQNAS